MQIQFLMALSVVESFLCLFIAWTPILAVRRRDRLFHGTGANEKGLTIWPSPSVRL